MQVWAITGPIGAGKSTAAGLLLEQGAAIVDGDQLGHLLLQRREIQAAIVQKFGAQFVAEGVVNRQSLGAHVFGDEAALVALNEIMHGPLGALAAEKLQILAAAGDHKLAVFEAAVYFRLPSPPAVDMVLVINAATVVRRERLRLRGLSAANVNQRLAAQEDLESQWSTADHVLWNDGSLADLRQSLVSLMEKYHLGSESGS